MRLGADSASRHAALRDCDVETGHAEPVGPETGTCLRMSRDIRETSVLMHFRTVPKKT